MDTCDECKNSIEYNSYLLCNKWKTKNKKSDIKPVEFKNAKDDLVRRVEATYRIRINAAVRLRNQYNQQKIYNYYYTTIVTALSILTMVFKISVLNTDFSNILLVCSVILSYYTYYMAEQNLQERAYKMEETYRELDRLRNKLTIYTNYNCKYKFDEEVSKKMYKEYERIISNIENHLDIDYKRYLVYKTQKEINEGKKIDLEKYAVLKKSILLYDIKLTVEKLIRYLWPIVAIVLLLIVKL